MFCVYNSRVQGCTLEGLELRVHHTSCMAWLNHYITAHSLVFDIDIRVMIFYCTDMIMCNKMLKVQSAIHVAFVLS